MDPGDVLTIRCGPQAAVTPLGVAMAESVTFASEGTALRGVLHPGRGQGARPAVVMAHGFTAVADQLQPQASALAAAGFTVLAFDHAGFGRSDGYPRQEVDPPRQLRGYRDAVSYARTRLEVDPGRIALWGSSFSGGHVLQATALDPRVKACVSQAPFVAGWDLLALRPDADEFVSALFAEREARSAGAPPTMIPVVAPGADDPCALPGADGYAWFTGTGGPTWKNEVTLSSFENVRAHEPALWIEKVAPRPLLMIVATEDVVTPTDHALAAFERAGEPKQLVRIQGGHFDVYGSRFDEATAATLAFLRAHL
jgi:fermentation-respiration switch protein FrsA (DUF1100 family)